MPFLVLEELQMEDALSGFRGYPFRFQRSYRQRMPGLYINIFLLTSPRSIPTSLCELSERGVTSPSHLKVVGALDSYSLVFVILLIFSDN
jgi:hypothetical protein